MPAGTDSPSTQFGSRLKSRLNSLVDLFSGQSARQGYLAAVDQGVISAANFLATIILARNVSPTELGVYGVGFVALRLVRSVQEGITIQPMNVFGASMAVRDFKPYATATSLIQIGLAFLSALVVAACGWILTTSGNDIAGPTLFSLWFAFLWWQMQEYIRRMLYTRQAIYHAVVNSVLANSVRLALMLLWASQGRLSGIAGLEAIAWGSLAALIPGLWFTRGYWTRHFLDIRETWRLNWNFGRWLIGGTVANWVSVEFYPVLTAGLLSFAAAGAYRALQNLVAPIHLLLRATDTFLTPRAADIFEKNGQRALAHTLKQVYIAVGLPVIGILGIAVLFPEHILYLFYGETYLAYSEGVVLMAIFYGLWYAYWPLQAAFKAARLSRPIFTANLLAILSMFTLGILAILRWGVYGTIVGQALNALIVGIFLWWTWLRMKRVV
jgi:O-antigen/teichoic acid export membrane protein